ncbi:MAG: HupE/UreJ family protein [Acidobacteriota bacterium]
MRALSVIVPGVVLVLWASAAAAHPAPFSYLDLRLAQGIVTGTLTVHDLDAAFELKLTDADALLDPTVARRHGAALANLLARRLHLRLDGADAAVTLSGVTPVPDRQGLQFTVSIVTPHPPGRIDLDATLFPYDQTHQTFVNVYEDDLLRQQAILDARHPTYTYYAGSWPGVGAVLGTFVSAGAYHIAIGPDHLLFLLGLLLMGGSIGRLGLIVTAFTVGHTITLSLAAMGVVTPPGRLIEPLIALSVVLVGVDNLLVGDRPLAAAGVASDGPASRDLRPWMAGLFGLVHGFGFASVLREFGLPREALGWSLFGFNLGVEFGQLVFVLPVALLLALIRRRAPLAGSRLAMVGSVVVALAGTWWFIQRVFFSGGAL